jgi:hypothetical protein
MGRPPSPVCQAILPPAKEALAQGNNDKGSNDKKYVMRETDE